MSAKVAAAPKIVVRRGASTTSVTSERSIDSKASKGSKGHPASAFPGGSPTKGKSPSKASAGEGRERTASNLSVPDKRHAEPAIEKRVSFGKTEDDLSSEEIRLVDSVWTKAKAFGLESLGWMLFTQFFKLEPKAKDLFPRIFPPEEDDKAAADRRIKLHGTRVVDTLDTVVRMLKEGKEDGAVTFLRMLGLKHVSFNAEPDHFDQMGQALTQVLCTTLGQDGTAEARNALQKFWEFVATGLVGAYRRLPNHRGPKPPRQPPAQKVPSIKITEEAIVTLETVTVDEEKMSPQHKRKDVDRAALSGLC